MSEPVSNYIQLKVPVANADLVFEALVWRYGMPTEGIDDDGQVVQLDIEAQAREALIGVIRNAVIEHRNMQALELANSSAPDLGIS